ncbi:MAG: RHS repeat-associated core domain-containing protein [Roseiflexaceae bacterium]
MKRRNSVVHALISALLVATLSPLTAHAHGLPDSPQAARILESQSQAHASQALPAPQLVSQDAPDVARPSRRAAGRNNASAVLQVDPSLAPEITTLAAGLENNPLALFDYVHNYIEYVPSWGLLKSPRETLLAGAGNAFEQAALLGALLDAAGFQTRYMRGDIRITKAQASNWVGAADPAVVGNVFASGGIPGGNEGGTLRLSHAWVQVFDGGAWHDLDPSFKTYIEQAGIDLRAAMGYTLPTFLSRAQSGSALTADYVQNLNQANIRADLSAYAVNLVQYLRAHSPFSSVGDLIGERRIVPARSSSYPAAPPYQVITSAPTPSFASIAYTLHIQMPGIDYTTRIDSIAGERITLFYECATPADCQLLSQGGGVYNVEPAYQVNMVPRLRVGGQVVDTGDPLALGTQEQIIITVTTPIAGLQPAPFSQTLTAGEWYALPMRLQTVSQRALVRQLALLDDAVAQGLASDEERVLGQTLHVLGLAYYNEVGLGSMLDARLAKVVVVPHFSMMIASRNLTVYIDQLDRPVQLDPASHTVDVRLNIDSAISAENPARPNRERAWFFNAGVRGSAVEHAILEQLQPIAAISTVQILKRAAEEHQRIYYITPTNQSLIDTLGQPLEIRNYLKAIVSPTKHIVISQSTITYGQWQGSGWIELNPTNGEAGYLIAGFLGSLQGRAPLLIRGGSGTSAQPSAHTGQAPERAQAVRIDLEVEGRGVARPDGSSVPGIHPGTNRSQMHLSPKGPMIQRMNDRDGASTPERPSSPIILDPVNAISGAAIFHQIDLANLGGLGIPLGFERFYTSAIHSRRSSLGYGWSHSYNMRFATGSDWARGFGSRTALEAAPALVAAQLGLDLFDAAPIPQQRFAIDTIVGQWLLAQITGNAAILNEPSGAVATYLRLSDGTYMPPAGSAILATVSINASGATLAWEDGTQLQFGTTGRLLVLIDANGNRTALTYDSQGRLSNIRDAMGRSLALAYNAQSLISQLTDPAGRLHRYSYDAQANLKTATDPRNGVTTYTYDIAHRLTSLTDRAGVLVATNQYDGLGRVVAQTDALGRETELLYGGDHTIVIDPSGARTIYRYDARGHILAIVDATGRRISARYDGADHLIGVTNGLNQTATFAYDARGRRTTTTDALGRRMAWAYDAAANLVSYTDQLGKIWRFTYDSQHNLTAAADPTDVATQYRYDSKGQLTQVQEAGIITTLTYDAHGNLACVRNALNQAACWAYDGVGRISSFSDETSATTQFVYDPNDNPTQITSPSNGKTRYTYDINNNLATTVDPNGHTTSYIYDARFNLVRVTDALGKSTQYAYDANDRLIRITDANGHVTTYQRDAAGRLTAGTDPLNRTIALEYDVAGQLSAFVRANGSKILYTRDALGRVIKIDYPTSPDRTFGYDAAGQLSSAAYGNTWSASYQYDSAGRLTSTIDGRGITLAYSYDAFGRQAGLGARRGMDTLYNLAYGYDLIGRQNRLTYGSGTSALTLILAYDAASRLAQIAYPNGASTSYGYSAGRLARISHQDGRGRNVASYAYSYDAAGNVTRAIDTTSAGSFATSYTYDALDRLTAETYPRYSIAYSYDAASNLARRADPLGTVDYTYDSANQLISRGDEHFNYDVHGNLASGQNALGTTTYAYDDENMLTQVGLPGGAALGFSYDAFARRIGAQTPAGQRSFLHDGLAVILEGGQTIDQASARYVYGAGRLLARQTNQTGLTSYHGDMFDNVRYLIGANGQPIDAYGYDAFGRAGRSAGVDSNPFGYGGLLGGYQHDVSGWPTQQIGFRYYDPNGARFLTRDPLPGDLGQPAGLNDYAYVLNNPLRYRDPLGLQPGEYQPGLTYPLSLRSRTSDRVGFSGASSSVEMLPSSGAPIIGAGGSSPGGTGAGSASISRLISLISMSGVSSLRLSSWYQWWMRYRSTARWRKYALQEVAFSSFPRFLDWLYRFGWPGGLDLASEASGNATEAAATQPWQRLLNQGGTYALACASNNHLLAGAFHAGIFSSVAAGHAIWGTSAATGANELVFGSPGNVYAGVRYTGVLKSSNGGVAWAPANSGLAANDVYALLAGPASGRLFVGTEMGLFISTNGGASWGRPPGMPPGRVVSELASSGSTLLAVTDMGLYRSGDSAATWQRASTGLPTAVHVNTLFTTSAGLFAGTALGLYKSTNQGAAWSLVSSLANRDVRALALDPRNAQRLFAGTTAGLFSSTNGGGTWAAMNSGLAGNALQIGAMAFCPAGGDEELYLGTGDGVYAVAARRARVALPLLVR